MKTILLFMSLFLSITVTGQTKVKYTIEYGDYDIGLVKPEGYAAIIQKAVHGRKPNNEMYLGHDDYWGKTLQSFRERHFTKEQIVLFIEKKYWLKARLIIDDIGNVKYVTLSANREFFESIPQKKLDDIYQACWELKAPIDPKWNNKNYYSSVNVKHAIVRNKTID